MLDNPPLDSALMTVASAALEAYSVSRVVSELTSDSEGHEAVWIRVVYSGAQLFVDGDLALETIVDLNQELRRRNDPRTAIITFVREDELESDDDPES